MSITRLDQMLEAVKAKARKRLVAAYANDAHTIEAVHDAVRRGIVDATLVGDEETIRKVCAGAERKPHINNTKGFIGHSMGAAGALELAGNLPSFDDHILHPCMNLEHLDPECAMDNIVVSEPLAVEKCDTILNTSFGMVGINSAVIVKRYQA